MWLNDVIWWNSSRNTDTVKAAGAPSNQVKKTSLFIKKAIDSIIVHG
jgi:hypothetical protein